MLFLDRPYLYHMSLAAQTMSFPSVHAQFKVDKFIRGSAYFTAIGWFQNATLKVLNKMAWNFLLIIYREEAHCYTLLIEFWYLLKTIYDVIFNIQYQK